MSKLFDDIMASLNELVTYEQGQNSDGIVVHRMSIAEVQTFTADEIRQVRLAAQMTQATFAACIGVTKKAVEAWEGGRSKPDGAARRTIGLLQKNPRYADEVGIIVR